MQFYIIVSNLEKMANNSTFKSITRIISFLGSGDCVFITCIAMTADTNLRIDIVINIMFEGLDSDKENS